MRDVLILKTNTKNFVSVITLLVGMMAGSILLSSPTHALTLAPLGLVQDTTDLVRDTTAPLLNVLMPKKIVVSEITTSPTTQPDTAFNGQRAQSTTNAASASQSSNSTSSTSSSGTASSSMISYAPLNVGNLKPITLPLNQASVNSHAALLAAVTSTSSLPELDAILHPALLQATKNGWQIAGLMWYWWVGIGAMIGGIGYFIYYHYKLYLRQKQLVS